MHDRNVDFMIHAFVHRQKELLTLDLKSETSETINNTEKRNSSDILRNVQIQNVSVGLYGRTVLQLANCDDPDKLLPSHTIKVGDDVEIIHKSISRRSGVVCSISETFIEVAMFGSNNDSEEDGLDGTLSVVPRSSADVHNKLLKALEDLDKCGVNHPICGKVINRCFQQESDADCSTLPAITTPFNTQIDASQKEAISFALSSTISLIHGPPGTGKTTTLAELIFQAVTNYELRILVTAPSNVAVDNVLERLVTMQQQRKEGKNKKTRGRNPTTIRMVRLGHPARIKPTILPYSLESLVQHHDGTDIVKDVRQELQSFLRIANNPMGRYADKKAAYRELKGLRNEIRAREEQVVQQLISNAHVVLCTNVGAANKILRDEVFDLVIIDEAAQALEASCWIPIMRGRRLCLAGDHCQLPPTIKNHAIEKELGVTLFERIMNLYQSDPICVSRLLQVQYRMHQSISDWASESMYKGRLTTFSGVATRKLLDLDVVTGDQPTMLLLDTAGCDMLESTNASGSRYNEGEAQLVVQHVVELLAIGLPQQDIAIISPYNGQVELLKKLLLLDYPILEIKSVDGFQGGEREAVVLSLVRSSNSHEIGFLRDDRRLNVAITRAKRHVCVVCDVETVSQSEFIAGLVDWIDYHGEHRSAIELQECDFADAERELTKMMTKSRVSETHALKKPYKKIFDDDRRKTLLHQISQFSESGAIGDELRLSPTLTSFDRRVVHEFATQLGLGHVSRGVVGADRHIVVNIQQRDLTPVIRDGHLTPLVKVGQKSDVVVETAPTKSDVPFTALDETCSNERELNQDSQAAMVGLPTPNQLLADVAKERQQRLHLTTATPARASTKKKVNKGGQKLGGTVAHPQLRPIPDDIDDMAFLDTQIEQVLNSHGRKIEGKGSYRTIVNGILISKPRPEKLISPDPKKKNALNAKLKQAAEDRKCKGKKK